MIEESDEDVIIWNTDKVDVAQAIVNITTHIREIYQNLKD